MGLEKKKMKKLTIVKIGGNVVDDPQKLQTVLKQFTALNGPKILVHGGGKLASEISDQMGIVPKMTDGRRITDSDTLKIVQMVYAGLINTNIVAALQSLNCDAQGMNGADGNSILALKRPIDTVDFGFVGDVIKINPDYLKQLLAIGTVPVFCALTHDGNGQILNTNADTITAELGKGLSQDFEADIIYCFEKKGVLQNPDNDDSVISSITTTTYMKLKDKKIISDGMIPKIDNAFDSLTGGVKNVYIIRFDELEKINNAHKPGTQISL